MNLINEIATEKTQKTDIKLKIILMLFKLLNGKKNKWFVMIAHENI